MPAADDIYRGEALEHHRRHQGNRGALLRISPAWTRWTYWLLVAVVAAGAGYVALGTVHEYATGPAVVRVEAGDTSVMAMLPGHDRPRLHPGLTLRLAMSGYGDRDLTIDAVGDAIVGPTEVRRILGDAIGDTVHVAGPVVIVRARLPATGPTYYEGLQGTAAARLGTESILSSLVPGLRRLFERS